MQVLVAAGLGLTAAATALLYALARRAMGAGGAALTCAAFLLDCAFAQLSSYGGYNFILPYSWAATYGLVAALLSAESLLRWSEGEGDAWLATAVGSLALAGLAKLEIGAAVALAHAAFWRYGGLDDGGRRRLARADALAALAALGVYAFFAASAGLGELLRRNLLIPHNLWGASQLRDAGVLGWPAALQGALLSTALTAAAAAVSLWPARAGGSRTATACRVVLAALAAAAIAWRLGPRDQFQCIPLLLSGLLAWRVAAGGAAPLGGLGLVLLLGAALLPRIALNCGAHHYGFYLLPAALIGYGYALWTAVPDAWLPARSPRWAYAAPMAAFLLVGILNHARASAERFRRRDHLVSGPRGSILLAGNEGLALERAVGFLAGRAPAAALAIPEGAGIGFLAGLRHPTALDSFLPRDLATPEAERRALAMIETARPDYVLLVPRDTSEFGVGPLGQGYGLKVADYLRSHYALEKMVTADQAGEPEYRVAILHRL